MPTNPADPPLPVPATGGEFDHTVLCAALIARGGRLELEAAALEPDTFGSPEGLYSVRTEALPTGLVRISVAPTEHDPAAAAPATTGATVVHSLLCAVLIRLGGHVDLEPSALVAATSNTGLAADPLPGGGVVLSTALE